MKGIELLKAGVRVANDRNIVRVPLKTGQTALLQLNAKAQKLDCVVLSKGKIVEECTMQNKTKCPYDFAQLIAGFMDKLAPNSNISLEKIIADLNRKAIK